MLYLLTFASERLTRSGAFSCSRHRCREQMVAYQPPEAVVCSSVRIETAGTVQSFSCFICSLVATEVRNDVGCRRRCNFGWIIDYCYRPCISFSVTKLRAAALCKAIRSCLKIFLQFLVLRPKNGKPRRGRKFLVKPCCRSLSCLTLYSSVKSLYAIYVINDLFTLKILYSYDSIL